MPKPRVLELSHRDEGNYPGKGSKVWVPGRRLSTAEDEQEVASTGYESLQKAPVPWEDRVRGRGCRQSRACGQERPLLATSRTLDLQERWGWETKEVVRCAERPSDQANNQESHFNRGLDH